MFVGGSHCDTPSQILRLRDLSVDNEYAHVDFHKLKAGGVNGAFFALYIPASLDSDPSAAWAYAMKLYDAVMNSLKENPERAALATTREEALENKKKGLFSVFLALENASAIGNSFERLQMLYDMGIRYITLCHTGNNEVCDSCATADKRWGGLSPFGKELVAEMNRLGILIDVSHVSDDTFNDVISYSKYPVVATHSCCRALAAHPRNMTDEMICSLAEKGGVIQINFYPVFLDSEFTSVLKASGIMERGEVVEHEFIMDPSDCQKRAAWNAVQEELLHLERPSYKLIADHIDHVVGLVGVDHVGFGSDFDGIAVAPDGMENASCFYRILDELRVRGYTEEELEKIAGDNFFRLMA